MWRRAIVLAASALLMGQAPPPTATEAYACITERVLGIERQSGGKVVAGEFKPSVDKFVLKLSKLPTGQTEAVAPKLFNTAMYSTAWDQFPMADGSYHQTFAPAPNTGLGWLILSSLRKGSDEITFQLGHVFGGQYLTEATCSKF